jgi:hypothetical protein
MIIQCLELCALPANCFDSVAILFVDVPGTNSLIVIVGKHELGIGMTLQPTIKVYRKPQLRTYSPVISAKEDLIRTQRPLAEGDHTVYLWSKLTGWLTMAPKNKPFEQQQVLVVKEEEEWLLAARALVLVISPLSIGMIQALAGIGGKSVHNLSVSLSSELTSQGVLVLASSTHCTKHCMNQERPCMVATKTNVCFQNALY